MNQIASSSTAKFAGRNLWPREVLRHCVSCKQTFFVDRWHSFAETCSPKCSVLKMSAIRSAIRTDERDLSPRPCKECGTLFSPSKYAKHNNVYCQPKCARKSCSREYAKQHPERVLANSRRGRWNGNWQRALERDGYKCCSCGAAEGLHVHHLDGSGEGDSPNHELDNLQTLCALCHKRVHTITYRIIDGEVVVSGLVFELLGVNNVRVAP